MYTITECEQPAGSCVSVCVGVFGILYKFCSLSMNTGNVFKGMLKYIYIMLKPVLLVFLFKIAIGPSYNILSSIILPPVHNM
jgi:hypothetical protein